MRLKLLYAHMYVSPHVNNANDFCTHSYIISSISLWDFKVGIIDF